MPHALKVCSHATSSVAFRAPSLNCGSKVWSSPHPSGFMDFRHQNDVLLFGVQSHQSKQQNYRNIFIDSSERQRLDQEMDSLDTKRMIAESYVWCDDSQLPYLLSSRLRLFHQTFTIRLHHNCKNITEKLRGKPIRYVFTKLLYLKGH